MQTPRIVDHSTLWLPGMIPGPAVHCGKLFSLVAAISLLLSWFTCSTHDPINTDGILYLNAAQAWLDQGFRASMHVYNWPLFPILLGSTSHLLHISLEHAAYVVNAILQAILCMAFLGILRTLGANKKLLYLGALAILLFPYLNSIRPLVIRDFGYWAMSLCGIWALLRFQLSDQWRFVAAWYFCMMTAFLFRVETAIFLVLAPFALLAHRDFSSKRRWMQCLRLYGTGAACAIIAIFLTHQLAWFSADTHSSRLVEFQQQFSHTIWQTWSQLQSKAQAIAQALPPSPAQKRADIFLYGGMILMFIVALWHSTTSLYVILAAYGITQRLLPGEPAQGPIIYGFIIINVLLLTLFAAQQLFLDTRYMMFLSLLLLLWIPGTLARFLEYRHAPSESHRRWLLPVTAILLAVVATGGIIRFGYSKAYLTEAGWWLKDNAPATALIYSNSIFIMHYAGRDTKTTESLKPLFNQGWKQYDYIALRIDKRDTLSEADIIKRLRLEPIQTFSNRRGDKTLIFKVPHAT